LEALLEEQPENSSLLQDLALVTMGLGDKGGAFTLIERALSTRPIENDAANGLQAMDILARIAARMGQPDRAIAALEKILSVPCNGGLATGMPLTLALLRLDPMFDPLRHDPRFQKLAEPKG
jgi:tetratricopeptide (TPR) repeat protein